MNYLYIPTDTTNVGDTEHRKYEPTLRVVIAEIPEEVVACFRETQEHVLY